MSDEFEGQGGAYEVRDGKRVRVEEPTKDHPEGNRPRDEHGKPLDTSSPNVGVGDAAEPQPTTPEKPRSGSRRLSPIDT